TAVECGELRNTATVVVGNEPSEPSASEGSETLSNVVLGNGTNVTSLALDEHSSTDMISVNATYHTINFDPNPPTSGPSTTVITGVGAFVWEVANALAV